MKNLSKVQQVRRAEVAKIKTLIYESIPAEVEFTSVLLALADITRDFTSMLIQQLEQEVESWRQNDTD